MQTPAQYAKQERAAGRFPIMSIEEGQYGTFWLHDGDWKMLDCKAFMSREAAEKFRSKVIEKSAR